MARMTNGSGSHKSLAALTPRSGAGVSNEPADEERHASNLELFLDLVFVFAVTQLAGLIAHDPTATGAAKAILVAFLVWWQWSQFTWAGSATNVQDYAPARALILTLMPLTLMMAVSIPHAFADTGRWFAWFYLAAQFGVLALQGTFAHAATSQHWQAFARYAAMACIGPVLIVVGSYSNSAQAWWWLAAALTAVVAALRAANGEWSLNPTHFAERHALFIIIALGEVVVAAGATTYGLVQESGLTASQAFATIVATLAAGALWWVYFAYVPRVMEHSLAQVRGPQRGVLARDALTFGHFPLVIGIVLFSVVVEHMIEHPYDPLTTADRWWLIGAVFGYTGGLLALRFRIAKRISPEGIGLLAAVGLLCGLNGDLNAVTTVAIVAALYAASHALRYALFKRELNAETARPGAATSV